MRGEGEGEGERERVRERARTNRSVAGSRRPGSPAPTRTQTATTTQITMRTHSHFAGPFHCRCRKYKHGGRRAFCVPQRQCSRWQQARSIGRRAGTMLAAAPRRRSSAHASAWPCLPRQRKAFIPFRRERIGRLTEARLWRYTDVRAQA